MTKSDKSGSKDSKSKKSDEIYKITIIPRATWGALPAKDKVALDNPIKEIIYTETATKTCSSKQECTKLVKDLQKYHMELKGLSDIDHNFLIGGDGNVYEARGWQVRSSSYEKEPAEGEEQKVLEIAFIGNFKEGDIPEEMRTIADNLINYGLEQKLIGEDEEDESEKEKDGDKKDEKSKDDK